MKLEVYSVANRFYEQHVETGSQSLQQRVSQPTRVSLPTRISLPTRPSYSGTSYFDNSMKVHSCCSFVLLANSLIVWKKDDHNKEN